MDRTLDSRSPQPTPRTPAPRGFTVVEVVVTLAIFAVLLVLTVPNFFAYNERRKLEGTAEQAAVLLRKARYDAIKRGQPVAVALDTAAGALFLDRDGDSTLDSAEVQDGVVRMPRGVTLGGPAGDAPAVVGFVVVGGDRVAFFEPNGSLRGDGGAFRLRDDGRNFLEVRVTDPATAGVVLRKWEDGAWRRKNEGDEPWKWQT